MYRSLPDIRITASDDPATERRRTEEEDDGSGKGAGRKTDVQRKPEDQRGRPDPKDGEGRGAP